MEQVLERRDAEFRMVGRYWRANLLRKWVWVMEERRKEESNMSKARRHNQTMWRIRLKMSIQMMRKILKQERKSAFRMGVSLHRKVYLSATFEHLRYQIRFHDRAQRITNKYLALSTFSALR
jgi:hypothetical protein